MSVTHFKNLDDVARWLQMKLDDGEAADVVRDLADYMEDIHHHANERDLSYLLSIFNNVANT